MASIAGYWLPELSTDACSIVCNAKEDVLASYQKTAWDLHLQEYSSLNSRCVWVYHSCLTQRLGSHKYAESVMYLLPYNIVIILIIRARLDIARSRSWVHAFLTMNKQTIISGHYGESHAQPLSPRD